MIFFLLLTGHLFGMVVSTLLTRRSAMDKINNLFLIAVLQTAIFAPTLIFLATGGVSFDHSLTQWLLLLLGGAMLTGYLLLSFWALTHLDASVFSIIFNLRLLVVTVLGYLILNELPPTLQIMGGLTILISILMLNLHKDRLWRSTGILIGFVSMIWFSLHAVLEKYNLNQLDFQTYFFIFAFVIMVLCWTIVFARRINIKEQLIYLKDRKIYWLMGTRALSGYSYAYALKFGSLAVVNYVSGMSVALIVFFGIYTLGERTHIKQKFIAVGVACVGLTLILISRLSQ